MNGEHDGYFAYVPLESVEAALAMRRSRATSLGPGEPRWLVASIEGAVKVGVDIKPETRSCLKTTPSHVEERMTIMPRGGARPGAGRPTNEEPERRAKATSKAARKAAANAAKSKYKPEFDAITHNLCRRGFVDEEIAVALGVRPITVWRWKCRYPSFAASFVGPDSDEAFNRVERAMFESALGEVRVRRGVMPPNVNMIRFVLTNRRRDRWTEKQAVEVSGTIGLADRIARAFAEKRRASAEKKP